MSDLESVDLSKESDSDASIASPPDEGTQTQDPALSKKTAMPSTPQRTPQRNAAARLTPSGSQNGTASPRRRLKERVDVTGPPPKPPTLEKTTSGKGPEKGLEKGPEKPGGVHEAVQNAPPAKPKRGRPKKIKTLPRSEVASVSRPQPPSKSTAAAEPTASATPAPTAKQATAPKNSPKTSDGEIPRPSGRGRKRQLLTKPVEATQAESTQEKTPATATPSSQEPPAPENTAPAPKRAAKAVERKLHGAAAKSAAQKRRREEDEHNITFVPTSKPSRGNKKDTEVPAPEVSEVPPSPVKKGRPSKRMKQQPSKDVTRPVPKEVIRIEDDDTSPERGTATVEPEDPASKEKQGKGAATTENGTKTTLSVGTAPAKGKQSLPASLGQGGARRIKTRNTASAAASNRRLDGPSQDKPKETEESASKAQSTTTRKQKERSSANPRPQRTRPVRHSTGNIAPMDTDEPSERLVGETRDIDSNKESLEAMLDEIQRNAIPFLLKQDKICDSFSARMEEDMNGVLKNTDDDVFQVFSDRVKDALVADRLRLAVDSAKSDLRRGIEKLLREFARRVGATLADEDSSLLLRNEAFRYTRRAKEERRLSKPFVSSSPRFSKLSASRRQAEENNDLNNTLNGDLMSDDADRNTRNLRTPNTPLKKGIPLLTNLADLRKFVAYSYDHLNLNCCRSCAILKLCARPGGMTATDLHETTPLGIQMIRNKVSDLLNLGYLVEDVIRENGVNVTVYSTAAHVSEL